MQEPKLNKLPLSFSIDLGISCLLCIIPMIMYMNHIFRGVYSIIPLFVLWFVFILMFPHKRKRLFYGIYKNQHLILFLSVFLIINIMHYLFSFGSAKARDFIIMFLYYIIFTILALYYQYDKQKLLSLFFLITIALAFQAAISIPYLLNTTDYIARMLASGSLDTTDSINAMKHGIGTNGLYTSNVLVIILGFHFIRYLKGFSQFLMAVSIIIISISVIISTFFASVILLGISLLLILINNFRNVASLKNLFVISIAILGFFLFYNNLLKDSILIRPIESKIERFASQGDDVTGRVDLTVSSVKTFEENLFWGIGVPDWQSYELVGEHMIWIDLFAHFGLIGCFPLLLFYFCGIYKRLIEPSNSYFIIALLSFFISNFISPMLIVPNTFIILVLFINSYSKGKI